MLTSKGDEIVSLKQQLADSNRREEKELETQRRICEERLIPLAPALLTFGDERAIGARLQPATDKMLIAPEATA